jgi:hypothetical protein
MVGLKPDSFLMNYGSSKGLCNDEDNNHRVSRVAG